MALVKVIPKAYKEYGDILNLINYLVDREKYAYGLTNIPFAMRIFNDPSNEMYKEVFTSQWCYAHKMYKPDADRTLCYHYVLAFDLSATVEYYALRDKDVEIVKGLYNLPSFKKLHRCLVVHQNDRHITEHVHIMIDSIDHNTGQATFFDFKELKKEIGDVLYNYKVALAGYTYETNGVLYLGECSPSVLYSEKFCIRNY